VCITPQSSLRRSSSVQLFGGPLPSNKVTQKKCVSVSSIGPNILHVNVFAGRPAA
jgi:hypothetical protein